jgi:putative acetyltransferase
LDQPGRTELLLVAEADGALVGNAGLNPVGNALRRRHAMGLGITVDKAWHGRGVGTQLMQALVDAADRWLGVLRIELTVYTDNAAAIALYHKFGFQVEGTHRAYALRDGHYMDVLAMARLHPNPPRIDA